MGTIYLLHKKLLLLEVLQRLAHMASQVSHSSAPCRAPWSRTAEVAWLWVLVNLLASKSHECAGDAQQAHLCGRECKRGCTWPRVMLLPSWGCILPLRRPTLQQDFRENHQFCECSWWSFHTSLCSPRRAGDAGELAAMAEAAACDTVLPLLLGLLQKATCLCSLHAAPDPSRVSSAASPADPLRSCTGTVLCFNREKRLVWKEGNTGWNAHLWSPVRAEGKASAVPAAERISLLPAHSDWHFLIFKITSSMNSQHFTRLKDILFPLWVIRSHLQLLQKDNGCLNNIMSCVGCFQCWWLHCD